MTEAEMGNILKAKEIYSEYEAVTEQLNEKLRYIAKQKQMSNRLNALDKEVVRETRELGVRQEELLKKYMKLLLTNTSR
jgi:hypothetical protein